MRNVKRASAAVLLISFVVASVACGSSSGTNKSQFVGKWTPSPEQRVFYGFPNKMEYFSDGTMIIDGNRNGTYSMVDGKLKLSALGQAFMFNYEVRGSRLTLTSLGEGRAVEYRRK